MNTTAYDPFSNAPISSTKETFSRGSALSTQYKDAHADKLYDECTIIDQTANIAGTLLHTSSADISDEDKARFVRALQKNDDGIAAIDIHADIFYNQEFGGINLCHIAAYQGHVWALDAMKEHIRDINAQTAKNGNREFYDTLTIAATRGHWNVVNHWLEQGWKLPELFISYRLLDAMGRDNQWTFLDTWLETTDRQTSVPLEIWGNMLERVAGLPFQNCEGVNRFLHYKNGTLFKENPEQAIPAIIAAVKANNTAALDALEATGIDMPRYMDGRRNVSTDLLTVMAIKHCSYDAYQWLENRGFDPFFNNAQLIGSSLQEDLGLINKEIEPILAKPDHPQHQEKKEGLRSFIRLALEQGGNPSKKFPTKTGHGTMLHNYTEKGLSEVNDVLIQEGFNPLALTNKGERAAMLNPVASPVEHGMLYEGYASRYGLLWELFQKGENPLATDDPTRSKFADGVIESKFLSDHPLAILHAFSAIGKLGEAMQPRYWHGNEEARHAALTQLYPYQQKQLTRERVSSAVMQPHLTEKPLRSWRATVRTSAALPHVSSGVKVGGM